MLPVILFGSFAEWKLSRFETPFTIKHALFLKALPTTQVLVTGNSHSFFGIDPDYFSLPGHNASYVSQDLFYDSQIIKRYLDKMPKLKMVIMSVDYLSIGLDLSQTSEAWRSANYWHAWGFKHAGGFDLTYLSMISFYGGHALPFLLWGEQADKEHWRTDGIKPNGWQFNPVHLTPEQLENQDVRDKVRNQMQVHSFALEENTRILREMAVLLEKRGIKLVFITMPIYKTFSRYEEPEQWAYIESTLSHICAQNHCRYINYERDPRFTRQDFADGDHFNSAGTAKFSVILDQDVIRSGAK